MITNGTTPKSILKQLAAESRVRLQDLLVMAPQNDPYNCGGRAQIEQGKWFAEWWNRLMETRGHIRKFWYKAVSQREPILMPDGRTLTNTESNWQKFQTYSKYARYLGFIDPLMIVDHRNPEPHLFAPEPVEAGNPEWEIEDWGGFSLPKISTRLWHDFSLPDAHVGGYFYRDGEQPCLNELWVEKSTMDDDLIPVCRRLGVNLITSTGFQSVTNAIACYSRAAEWAALGRPVRIFYLSDFDPAGDCMPLTVSRQLEFWREQYGPDVDVALTPLGLTKAQVEEYGLPTIPIKDSDKRRDGFLERYGVDGAVELDALEAIHPGVLAELVADAVAPYRDDDLEIACIDADVEATELVNDEWEAYLALHREAAEELGREAEAIVEEFEPELRKFAEAFNERMNPVREKAEQLEAAVHHAIDNCDLQIFLPPRPIADIVPPDESNWLFSSGRKFAEQLARYRKHQQGS